MLMDYKTAGVDIEEGYRAVEKYRDFAASTISKAVLNNIGGFGGMYSLKEFFQAAEKMEEPVLVSGTDGVGTKLDIAFKMKKYDTVGIDCVAMCVNDILCHGARPLFFLDYMACGKLDAAIAAELVKGVAAGCRETGTVLLGGETAEHPGLIPDDTYDLAGFTVGIVDRKKIINGEKVSPGDSLLGVSSSGVHSNGFSMIRKVLSDLNEDFHGRPIGRVLLEPTRLYVKPLLELMEEVEILGMAHITGGGLYENIPRIFSPENKHLVAVVKDPLNQGYTGSWKIPPIFARIAYGIKNKGLSSANDMQKEGEEILFSDLEIRKLMFNTYNMGIGFVLALKPGNVQKAADFLGKNGFPTWEIGRVENFQDHPRASGNETLATNQNAGLCFV